MANAQFSFVIDPSDWIKIESAIEGIYTEANMTLKRGIQAAAEELADEVKKAYASSSGKRPLVGKTYKDSKGRTRKTINAKSGRAGKIPLLATKKLMDGVIARSYNERPGKDFSSYAWEVTERNEKHAAGFFKKGGANKIDLARYHEEGFVTVLPRNHKEIPILGRPVWEPTFDKHIDRIIDKHITSRIGR